MPDLIAATEQTPVTMTDEQRKALVLARQSILRLISEKDAYLRPAAALTEDTDLIASVGLLGALLGDLRERCRVLIVKADAQDVVGSEVDNGK